MRKNHYGKALFPSREGNFPLRWIKRNTRDKEKGLLGHFEKVYRRGWACNALALEIEDGTLRQQSPIVVHNTNHYCNKSL